MTYWLVKFLISGLLGWPAGLITIVLYNWYIIDQPLFLANNILVLKMIYMKLNSFKREFFAKFKYYVHEKRLDNVSWEIRTQVWDGHLTFYIPWLIFFNKNRKDLSPSPSFTFLGQKEFENAKCGSPVWHN